MLDYDAEIDADCAYDQMGSGALHEACHHNRLEVAQLLLDHGASTSIRAAGRDTPLDFAVGEGHSEMVHLLLSNGASIAGVDGYIALCHGIRRRRTDCVRGLIEGGADPAFAPRGHLTPVELAYGWGFILVVETIVNEHRIPVLKNSWANQPSSGKDVDEQSLFDSVERTVGQGSDRYIHKKWRRDNHLAFSEHTPPLYLGIIVPDFFHAVRRAHFPG